MNSEIVTDVISTAEAVTEALTTEAAGDMFSNLKFEPMNFIDNLSYMGAGMFSIFAVILVIVGIVYGLNAIFKK